MSKAKTRRVKIALTPIAAAEVPELPPPPADAANWIRRSRFYGMSTPLVAVRLDGKAALVWGFNKLCLARAEGRGRAIAQRSEIVAAGFAGELVVVLTIEALERFEVVDAYVDIETRIAVDVDRGAGLAIPTDGAWIAALAVAKGRKLGRVRVFDGNLQQLAMFDDIASIRAVGNRMFAFGARGKAFEFTGLPVSGA